MADMYLGQEDVNRNQRVTNVCQIIVDEDNHVHFPSAVTKSLYMWVWWTRPGQPARDSPHLVASCFVIESYLSLFMPPPLYFQTRVIG